MYLKLSLSTAHGLSLTIVPWDIKGGHYQLLFISRELLLDKGMLMLI